MGESNRIESLATELFNSNNKYNREVAVKALAKFDYEKVYTYMIKALRDRSNTVKEIALQYLGDHVNLDDDGRVLEKHLIPLANNSKSYSLRYDAISAIGKYEYEKVNKILFTYLLDEEGFVIGNAVTAIMKFNDVRMAFDVLANLRKY